MKATDRPMRVGFAVPGGAERLAHAISGGYEYDRRLVAGLAAEGVEAVTLALPEAFPSASAADRAVARAALTRFEGPLLVDGLGFQSIDAALARDVADRLVALVHHPLSLEPGLAQEDAAAVAIGEKTVVDAARSIIVTSPKTAELAAEVYGVDAAAIVVAEPGVDPAPRAPADGAPPHLLSVGSVIPRKGYATLVDAMATLRDLDWRLDIVGPTTADPAHAALIRARIDRAALEDRIRLRGPVPPAEMGRVLQGADLFVSTATLEGYGMAAAEAINCGLPVVAASEAILSWAPSAIAIAPPQDADAVAAALSPLLLAPTRRRAAADASWENAARLPRWTETAKIVATALRRLRA